MSQSGSLIVSHVAGGGGFWRILKELSDGAVISVSGSELHVST